MVCMTKKLNFDVPKFNWIRLKTNVSNLNSFIPSAKIRIPFAYYSKTSQDGHPLGNAKVAFLQMWLSYGNLHDESKNKSGGVSRGVKGNKP